MNIHEFQAKRILEKYGIPVPEFDVISSLAELEYLLQTKGWKRLSLKFKSMREGEAKREV